MLRVGSTAAAMDSCPGESELHDELRSQPCIHNLQPHTFDVLPGMTQWPTLLSIRRMPDESARNFRTWKMAARINNPECKEHARRILTQQAPCHRCNAD